MASAFEKMIAKALETPGAAPHLEDALSVIQSGVKQGKVADAHRLGREGLNKEFVVDVGGKRLNLAPEAPLQVQLKDGRIVSWSRRRMDELPSDAKVLNFTPEKIESLLPPAPAKPAPKPTVETDETVQAALDATRARRLGEEAQAQKPKPANLEEDIYAQAEADRASGAANRPAEAPAPSEPTFKVGDKSGPWSQPGSSVPNAGMSDAAYQTWLRDANRRANALTQAGAATGAGALYANYLSKNKTPDEGVDAETNFSPRRDQPAQFSPASSYSPITDTAKDILRQRVNAPMAGSYAGNEGRGEYNPVLGPVPMTDEGRSEYNWVLGAQPMNPGRGAAPGMNIDALSAAIKASQAGPSQGGTTGAARQPFDLTSGSRAASTQETPSSSPFAALAKYFSSGQEPKTREELWKAANEDPENKAAFFRAAKTDVSPTAEKRGGPVKSHAANGKDGALHKALDIIHAMMMRGR